MNKKIIFTAGGTGGHIFPAINLMKHFSKKGYEVILVTDKRGKDFIKGNSEFKSYIIKADTPTRKNFFKIFFTLFIILYSLIKSFIIIKKEKPNLVIGFGGYVSFPISYASKFFNLPLIIYENNLILGRANKYLLSIAKNIFLSKIIDKNFPEKYKKKILITGSILEKRIINYSQPTKKNDNKNLSILILGGSQGAEIFGKIIPPVINIIKNNGYNTNIYQQCTTNQKDSITNFYNKNNINNYVFAFDKNIIKLISISDMAITRCGASTTAELVHTSTPFVAVPLPNSIDNHQYLNAIFYKENGCCWLLEQKNFNEENLTNLIMEIIKNKNKLENIRKNMKTHQIKNVYSVIENKIRELI